MPGYPSRAQPVPKETIPGKKLITVALIIIGKYKHIATSLLLHNFKKFKSYRNTSMRQDVCEE